MIPSAALGTAVGLGALAIREFVMNDPHQGVAPLDASGWAMLIVHILVAHLIDEFVDSSDAGIR